jgi:hypothetical protein
VTVSPCPPGQHAAKSALNRYSFGTWGDVEEEMRAMEEEALEEELLAAFNHLSTGGRTRTRTAVAAAAVKKKGAASRGAAAAARPRSAAAAASAVERRVAVRASEAVKDRLADQTRSAAAFTSTSSAARAKFSTTTGGGAMTMTRNSPLAPGQGSVFGPKVLARKPAAAAAVGGGGGEPLAREEAGLRGRAARAVRSQAKQPGWLNAHGLSHDYYTEKLTGSRLFDKPGWGRVDSEVLTQEREEYVPPPPPDLSEALTNDRNAFKPGFTGRAGGPVVPQLSRASQRKRQEEAAKERATQQEAQRIADAVKAVDDAKTVADLPIPYVEGRSEKETLGDEGLALEDQHSRTLWTQAHNHDMIRGNPRGRHRAVEVLAAHETTWGAIHGVRRVRVLKDAPVGWAVVIEFKIGVDIPEARLLPPLWWGWAVQLF